MLCSPSLAVVTRRLEPLASLLNPAFALLALFCLACCSTQSRRSRVGARGDRTRLHCKNRRVKHPSQPLSSVDKLPSRIPSTFPFQSAAHSLDSKRPEVTPEVAAVGQRLGPVEPVELGVGGRLGLREVASARTAECGGLGHQPRSNRMDARSPVRMLPNRG